jgi:hypothetical protein
MSAVGPYASASPSAAWRRALPGALISLMALLSLAGVASAHSSAAAPRLRPFHSCGSVGSSVGSGYGEIHAYGITCRAARRVITRALDNGTPRGWTFSYNGAAPDEFRKGRRRITGVPLGDRPQISSRRSKIPHLFASERNLYEPPSYCPSNHTCFSNAEWLAWGPTSAVASATGETSYPAGPQLSEEIRFTFYRPQHICRGYYYTRARWRYAGEREYTKSFLLPPACIWSGA